MSATVHACETAACIGGTRRAIPAAPGGESRTRTAHQAGRPERPRGAASMFWADMAARRHSRPRQSGGAINLASAHERAPVNSGRGGPPMHGRHIRPDGGTGANLEGAATARRGALQGRGGGGRISSTPGVGMRRIRSNVAGSRAGNAGCTPWGQQGSTLGVPASGLPPYGTRRTTAAPPSSAQQGRPPRPRRPCRGFRRCRSGVRRRRGRRRRRRAPDQSRAGPMAQILGGTRLDGRPVEGHARDAAAGSSAACMTAPQGVPRRLLRSPGRHARPLRAPGPVRGGVFGDIGGAAGAGRRMACRGAVGTARLPAGEPPSCRLRARQGPATPAASRCRPWEWRRGSARGPASEHSLR